MGPIATAPDISACDREPIHIPGSIQPHGIMLVLAQESLRLLRVAGDIHGRLGVTEWQNTPVEALLGADMTAKIAAVGERSASGGFVGRFQPPPGGVFDVSAHCSGRHVVVELEARAADDPLACMLLDELAAAAASFEDTPSLAALCESAAVQFRRLTGFDRVMIYKFLDDGAGKVLAEDRRQDLRSFLNQHFPGTDIPLQARALYVRNLVRVIPDISYTPQPLRPHWEAEEPLDMSACSLRSVSPIHLQYLANMGVSASASFSIVRNGTLWGLVACHNVSPKLIPYDVRAACASLVGTLARQISAKEEAEGFRQRIRLRSFEDDIVDTLSRDGPLGEVLANHLSEIGRMMGSDGIAIVRGNELATSGICPDASEIRGLAAWLAERTLESVFATDSLVSIYPEASRFRRYGSGVLAITPSAEEPWVIIWFRAEQVEIVSWAGNPHKGAADDAQPLAPRASFDAWAETVSGRARAWSVPEIDAAGRLRTALLDVRQNRRILELNQQLTKILHDKDQLLQQKEFLVGEVNHRVQNSLQLVSGFLALQGRDSGNPELKSALEEARRRLTAVALVHRRLYRGDQLERVNAARYIEELCADTFSFLGKGWAKQATLDLSPVLVSTDRAVTLGLVLTELMINANKHAYGGNPGPLEIRLSEDQTHLRLSVADKGSGISSTRKGFGSRIIDGLVTQLRGELQTTDNQPGLRTIVVVPLERPGHSLA